jgi:hypothetical protein
MYVGVIKKTNIDLSIRNSSRQKVSSHSMNMHSARASSVTDSWLERAPRVYIAGHAVFKFHNKMKLCVIHTSTENCALTDRMSHLKKGKAKMPLLK